MTTAFARTIAQSDRELAERRFIAAFFLPDAAPSLDDYRNLPPDAFSEYDCRDAWRLMRSLPKVSAFDAPPKLLPFLAIDVGLGTHFQRDRDAIFTEWLKDTGFANLDTWLAALPAKTSRARVGELLTKLDAHSIVAALPPPTPTVRLTLAGKEIATPGNLVAVIAKAKSGKTAGVGAMVAAAVAASNADASADTLGFAASDPGNAALLIFDTEQCPSDAHACLMRALRRAETDEQPSWLEMYALAGWTCEDMRTSLRPALERARTKHGAVFAVVLDGVADFVADVNDPQVCNPFVQELHGLAIEFECPIICVIHSNEGRLAGDDGRGHLGKQLTRKAESNLLFRKSGEITTITSEKQRRAPITAEDGIAFRWSDSECRHVSCGSPASAKEDAERSELRDLADEVFAKDRALQWSGLAERIERARKVSINTAGRRIAKMTKLGVTRLNEMGLYERIK